MGYPTHFYLSGAVAIYRTSSNFLLLHSFLFIKIFFPVFFSSFLHTTHDAIRHTSVENKHRTKVILLWAKNMVKNKP